MSCTPQPPHRPQRPHHPQQPHRPQSPQRQSPPSCSQRSGTAQRRRSRDPLVPAPFAPSVSAWLAASLGQEPLAPATVLELSRRVQAWRHQPSGHAQAPCAMRRRALQARNQLACHYLRLVSHTWQRHRSVLPPQEEATADALQEAAIALLRAAELFDPSRGYRFSTYASFWVRRGFEEHERRQRRMVRLPSSWVETLRRVASLVNRYRTEGRCSGKGAVEPRDEPPVQLAEREADGLGLGGHHTAQFHSIGHPPLAQSATAPPLSLTPQSASPPPAPPPAASAAPCAPASAAGSGSGPSPAPARAP